MTNLKKVLAFNMKLYRKTRCMTQAKLAETIEAADNYIALIESGRRFPSVGMLEKIAAALDIDILELFSIKPIEQSQKKLLKTVLLGDIEEILTKRLHEMG